MRVALVQINSVLADFSANKEKILEYIDKARSRKADLVVFPECALFGYAPFDLLERKALIRHQDKALKEIEKHIPEGMAVLLGVLSLNPRKTGRPYFNSAALLERGKKTKLFHKTLLPTGDVFDEARFIQSGSMDKNFFTFKKKKFFVSICEDIWAWPDNKGVSQYQENPIKKIKGQKVDLVINLSASPWHPRKLSERYHVAGMTAKHFKAPLIYVNMVGGQDEIIYDGRSFALDKNGKEFLHLHAFEEDINLFELDTKQTWAKHKEPSATESLRRALVLGLQDFCRKTGMQKVHFGLSGGIDSAVVAALAVDALGASNVTAIAIPGPHSSDLSFELAQKLAKNMNINFLKVEMNKAYEAVVSVLEKGIDLGEFGLPHENIQARLRGLSLMAFSNNTGSMLLNTSNKSEFASGYSTLYGDMCGGLCPLGDLTKAQVYALAKLYNSEHEIIPNEIITRPPTAELRPNQRDQDSLPAYDLLDKAVENLVEFGSEAKSKEEKWLLPILMRTEFKRWQAPPILKVSKHSFGRGRRYPIAHRAQELQLKKTAK